MSNAAAASSELGHDVTLMVRDNCLCLHVQRAARALARRFDDAFRPFDLTNGQFSLLMSLNRPQPPTLGSVASLLAMDRTTLTAALKPLERRGLVKVAVDKEDRRSRLPVAHRRRPHAARQGHAGVDGDARRGRSRDRAASRPTICAPRCASWRD